MAKIPTLPASLKKSNFKKLANPLAMKGAYQSNAFSAMAAIERLEKFHATAVVETSERASKALTGEYKRAVAWIDNLIKTLSKDKSKAATLKSMQKTRKDLDVLKKDWNTYTYSWKPNELGALPNLKKNYTMFAKKDFALENINFLTAAPRTSASNHKAIWALFEEFVKPRAKQEININGKIRAGWCEHATTVGIFLGKAKDRANPGVKPCKMQVAEAVKALDKLKGLACKEIHSCIGDSMKRYAQACAI